MTALEFFNKNIATQSSIDENGNYCLIDIENAMTEFAKFHVQRALEFTANNAEVILIEGKNEISDDEWGIMDQDGHYIKFVPNKKLILEKYSLNNIT